MCYAIYAHALTKYPSKKELWMAAAYFEKEHGIKEIIDDEMLTICTTTFS
jgi:hypothetical protein